MPIVLLKTIEMEYLGYPYTRCVDGAEHSTQPVEESDNGTDENPTKTVYDITICKMLRHVEAIVKIWCFHYSICIISN